MNLIIHNLLLLFLFLFLIPSCAGTDEVTKKNETEEGSESETITAERVRLGALRYDGLHVVTVDINEDKKPDQWKVFDKIDGNLQRIERDLNFDGKKDTYSYFGSDGMILESETDLDLDSQIDVVNYYRNGIIFKKELAIGFDGNFVIFKYYDTKGNLVRAERDTDRNGMVDIWEFYENKELVKVVYDRNKDGIPDDQPVNEQKKD